MCAKQALEELAREDFTPLLQPRLTTSRINAKLVRSHYSDATEKFVKNMKTTLRKTIRLKRLEAGLSMCKLARVVGVSKQSVSNIESGQTAGITNSKGVIALCCHFGIDRALFKDSQIKRKIKKVKTKKPLGALLANRRRKLGITRNKLSELVGVPSSRIHSLEIRGEMRLSFRLKRRLEIVLKCIIPENYFYGYDELVKNSRVLTKLAGRVRKYRQKRGWSIEDLAKQAGVCSNSIRRIENRMNGKPRSISVIKTLRALRIKIPRRYIL